MKWGIWLSLLVSISACSKSESSSTPTASQSCDPLSVAAEPITLGNVVAAGRAADGTVYAIDNVGGPEARAFVSEGTLLRRHKVGGSGSGSDVLVLTVDTDLQLRVELSGGVARRMGVYRGPPEPKTKSFEIGVQGEELTLISPADLAVFTLVNITSEALVYAATTSDGHRFFVFEPTIDLSDEKVRVFYGMPDAVKQRKVISVSRDSTIQIVIDIDGVTTTAKLAFRLGSYFGAPRLEPSTGEVTALVPDPGSPGDGWDAPPSDAGVRDAGHDADAATLVAGAHFVCF